MDLYAHIVGWGMYAPETVVTNNDLAKIINTSDAWIRSRTGIRERHIANEKESTVTLATRAAKEALDRARIRPAAVDLVIVATFTPDYVLPSTASLVQNELGARHAGAFDVNAGCTGFIYALSMASAMIEAGHAEVVVVVGAETLSRVVDWQDRATCVLFGDGAGAVVLQAGEDPGGVLSTVLGSDGAGGNHLIIPGGGSRLPATPQTVADRQHFIKMNGPEVFKFATRVMGRAAKEAVEKGNVRLEDIDLFIPHQANARIIKSAAKYLKLNPDKVYQNLQKYGNTSSASIPIALCEAIAEGRVKDNDNLVLVGFGAGLTWGATVVKWGLPVPYQQRQWWYRALRSMHYRWAKIVAKIGWLLRVLESRMAHRLLRPLEYEPEPEPEAPDAPAVETIAPPEVPPGANGRASNGHASNGDAAKLPEPTIEQK